MATQLCVEKIRDLKTGWLQSGDPARPLLYFLHGYPDTAETWDKQLDYFGANYHVVAPFARGARPSAAPDGHSRYTLNAVCLDHLEIMQRFGVGPKKKVVLIGHDLGGPVAWRLANLLGSNLAGLIIINSLSTEQAAWRLWSDGKQRRKSSYALAFMSEMFRTWWIAKNPAKLLLASHKRGELPIELRPQLAKSISGVLHPVKHYRAFLPEIVKGLWQKPERVTEPVLVLWGKRDAFLEIIQKPEMDRLAANYTIRILDANHWLHREQAAVVNELIEEFVCNLALT